MKLSSLQTLMWKRANGVWWQSELKASSYKVIKVGERGGGAASLRLSFRWFKNHGQLPGLLCSSLQDSAHAHSNIYTQRHVQGLSISIQSATSITAVQFTPAHSSFTVTGCSFGQEALTVASNLNCFQTWTLHMRREGDFMKTRYHGLSMSALNCPLDPNKRCGVYKQRQTVFI